MNKTKLGPLPELHIRTAHDVRHLVVCAYCGELGDDRCMICARSSVFQSRSNGDACYHGRCYIKYFGLDRFLNLPKAQTNKVAIGDIGAEAARKLLDHWDACAPKGK